MPLARRLLAALKRVGEKFVALFQHSFAILKLQYLLRTAPCYQPKALAKYDNTLRSIMGKVTNSAVMSDDRAWIQATLPVKLGGLGMRSAVEVASSAYLDSLHTTSTLVETILPLNMSSTTPSLLGDALSCWSEGHDFQSPDGDDAHRQKSWDQLRAVAAANQLMEGAVDDIDRTHLLASRSKESGAWQAACSSHFSHEFMA